MTVIRSVRRGAAGALLATALLATVPALAQPPDASLEELRRRAVESDLAWEVVASLTTEVGPRLAGSDGDRRAVAWGVAKLEELGFSNVRAEPVEVPRWERGEAEAEILSPYPQRLSVVALGGSVGTPEEGVTARVVRFASLADLEAAEPEAVAGRIVFLDTRMERRRDGSGYGETVPIRTRGAARAAEKGALAVLIRSVGTGPHRFGHTGTTRYEEGGRQIPAAALALPDADLLARQAATGEPVRVRLRMTSRSLGTAQSANVVGEIRGRRRPEEIVLLTCHLDSWDLGTGAIDDASGCGIVVAAARLLADFAGGPDRTIRVLLAANEEFGLSGAKAYAQAHEAEIGRHVLGLEADLGAAAPWRFATRFAATAEPLVMALTEALAPLGLEYGGNEATGGADLVPLRPLGVPFASIDQDAAPYFDVHHTADDTLSAVDPEGLRKNVAAYAVVAHLVGSTDLELRPVPPFPPPATP